MAEQLK